MSKSLSLSVTEFSSGSGRLAGGISNPISDADRLPLVADRSMSISDSDTTFSLVVGVIVGQVYQWHSLLLVLLVGPGTGVLETWVQMGYWVHSQSRLTTQFPLQFQHQDLRRSGVLQILQRRQLPTPGFHLRIERSQLRRKAISIR